MRPSEIPIDPSTPMIHHVQRVLSRGPVRSFQSMLSAAEDKVFDYRYGLETSEVVEVEQLDINEEQKESSVRYKPTRVRYFNKLMQSLSLPKNCVFVDIGCGKGRIMLLAAKYGFSHVVGLEISSRLSEVARNNLIAFHRHHPDLSPTTVICENVLNHRLEGNEGVFFLFWPFDRSVTISFLDAVRDSVEKFPRDVWLVFNEFQFSDLLINDDHFKRVHAVTYGAAEFEVYRYTHHESGAEVACASSNSSANDSSASR